MDISSKNPYPSSALSNFAAHSFVLDGVRCASMEGFLQSLKIRDVSKQKYCCLLVGWTAKKFGANYNDWKARQKLFWKGAEIDRHSSAYQILIDRAYDALSQNKGFQDALKAAGSEKLTHYDGEYKDTQTVLTPDEFIKRLDWLREKLFGIVMEDKRSEKMKKFLR